MDDLDIRYTRVDDYPHLLSWLKDPDINRWFPMSSDKEIEDVAKNWIGFSKYNSSLTGIYKNEVCAVGTIFLMSYKKIMHHAMFYLVVKKDLQKKGIGSSMLKNILNLAKNYFKFEGLFAETYEGCPIIDVLKKMKFNECADQPMFVQEKDGQFLSRILLDIWF